MKIINLNSELIDEEYYLCYEVFVDGKKNVFIGKYNLWNETLIGIYFSNLIGTAFSWNIYDNFSMILDDKRVTQTLFKLSKDEILNNIVINEV